MFWNCASSLFLEGRNFFRFAALFFFCQSWGWSLFFRHLWPSIRTKCRWSVTRCDQLAKKKISIFDVICSSNRFLLHIRNFKDQKLPAGLWTVLFLSVLFLPGKFSCWSTAMQDSLHICKFKKKKPGKDEEKALQDFSVRKILQRGRRV